MARDAQHRLVVECEEVVLSLAHESRRLVVLDDRHLVPEVAHETARIGILFVGAAEQLDNRTVVQAKAREVLHQFDIAR